MDTALRAPDVLLLHVIWQNIFNHFCNVGKIRVLRQNIFNPAAPDMKASGHNNRDLPSSLAQNLGGALIPPSRECGDAR